ncbi:ascc3 [Symbiodinium sp. KB8]|nr:ascc3 [Symbiodinium sp. KB8]
MLDAQMQTQILQRELEEERRKRQKAEQLAKVAFSRIERLSAEIKALRDDEAIFRIIRDRLRPEPEPPSQTREATAMDALGFQFWSACQYPTFRSDAVVSVGNDLQTPIEVKLRSGDWQVVYPERSWNVKVSDVGATSVEVRLRENPALKGSCKVTDGSSEIWASVDFESFSREAKGRDRAEARELTREGKRRKEAQMRTEKMIQEAAAEKRNADALGLLQTAAIVTGFPLVLLIICVAIPPGSALAAALLASATVPLSCCLSILSVVYGWPQEATDDFDWGKYAVRARFGFRLLGFLALALLLLMTVQHALQGFSWTAAILWPVPLLCGGGLAAYLWASGESAVELNAEQRDALEREREEAQRELSNRTIRFEGSVVCERGRPCVASWPGKYAGAWESLVSQGRNGEVSAAVVFLPEGTDDYGECDSIPLAEGLPGTCWCTPLYGEKKPWGCRWFTKWRENIETAVKSGAELEVYYFQNHVGKGKVETFDTAGNDNLHREKVNKKQSDFEESPEFQQALDAGLLNLSKEPRGDGSSQYSREARRLFLASLSETEREYLATSTSAIPRKPRSPGWKRRATRTGRWTSPRGSRERELRDTSHYLASENRKFMAGKTTFHQSQSRWLENRNSERRNEP